MLGAARGRSLSLSGHAHGRRLLGPLPPAHRFNPQIRTAFGRGEESRWIERYGFVEHTIGRDDDAAGEDGCTSRRRKYRKVVREQPGLAPAAVSKGSRRLLATYLQALLGISRHTVPEVRPRRCPASATPSATSSRVETSASSETFAEELR